jgi:hypothetical protein
MQAKLCLRTYSKLIPILRWDPVLHDIYAWPAELKPPLPDLDVPTRSLRYASVAVRRLWS